MVPYAIAGAEDVRRGAEGGKPLPTTIWLVTCPSSEAEGAISNGARRAGENIYPKHDSVLFYIRRGGYWFLKSEEGKRSCHVSKLQDHPLHAVWRMDDGRTRMAGLGATTAVASVPAGVTK